MTKRTKSRTQIVPPPTMKNIATGETGVHQTKDRRLLDPETNRCAGGEFLCIDCGVDTNEIGEIYWVKRNVWARSGLSEWDGYLCVGCLEQRLGRRLRLEDFLANSLINRVPMFRSTRLKSRMFHRRPGGDVLRTRLSSRL
jgi:hypothetical protein